MLMQMDEMQARLDTLVEALDGQDPGAIIAASEALATAVILFRNSTIPAGAEQRARLLITRTLGQLEAAAIRVNDLLNGAFGLALPEVMPAASGGVVVPLVVAEPNSAGGQNVQVVEPMIGGTGARDGADGVDGRDSGISNLANNPVETVEAEIAVEILRYALRPDSGGPGRWRGGCGLEITFRVLKDGAMVLGRGMERAKFRPWGMRGGRPGARTEMVINEGTPDERRFGKIDVLPVNRGDIVTLRTAGAGGYGDPFARDPVRVLRDVRRGLVSPDAAARDYGVVVRDGHVDAEATARRRRDHVSEDAPHAFGAERAAWQALFTPDRLDRLNAALFRLPAAQRTKRRTELYRATLQDLPANFPLDADAEAVTAAQRARLDAAIAAIEQA